MSDNYGKIPEEREKYKKMDGFSLKITKNVYKSERRKMSSRGQKNENLSTVQWDFKMA
jgi:hypothetical protein